MERFKTNRRVSDTGSETEESIITLRGVAVGIASIRRWVETPARLRFALRNSAKPASPVSRRRTRDFKMGLPRTRADVVFILWIIPEQ